MKILLSLIMLFVVVGCNKGEVKPDPIVKPPVVDPKPSPSPVVHKDAEFCKAEGKKFQCGTNLWWHLDCLF